MLVADFSEWTIQNLILRVVVSMLLGGVIGLDRGMKHRGAGTKTITVVCLASTLVMLTEQYIQINFPGLANMNRLAAQVISGVGFIGVGTIIISKHRVRGLTTAATLWASACVGLAVGIGFIEGGVLITAMMLISLHVLPYVERFATRHSRYCNVFLDLEKSQDLHVVIQDLKEAGIAIDSMDMSENHGSEEDISVHLVLYVKKAMERTEIYGILTKSNKVTSVDFL
ncbi:MAG: MgtC/SapB family protein [Bacteroidales bacterium]|nr:MgtC/SapB family protein [Bacteroidales bacterium]MCM1415177.1 MgtC/SapB family protein [bacterium]MCM1423363.1 MgtC/SapB family protein [bacterium]